MGFDSYRYEQDAPIDAPAASPWPTLASDSRRSGYAPAAWLPSWTDASLFADAGQATAIQPAFVDETAYFGAKQPEYRGFDSWYGPSGVRSVDSNRNGWSVPKDDGIAAPTVVGNAVFVTGGGVSQALDRRDGTTCWAYHGGSSYPTASPTVVDGTAYLAGERVFALAARTGAVRWRSERLEFGPRGTAAAADAVFVTTGDGTRGAVSRFDAETGQREWRTTTDSPVPVPPVIGERVYVFAADGHLRALDRSDGSEAWSHQFAGRSAAMPAVAQGTVYAAATNGTTLKAFDAGTGAVRWTFEFDGARAMGPTASDNVVYLPTSTGDGGRIETVDAEDGSLLIANDLPHPPASSLVIGAGVGLISTQPSGSETHLHVLRQFET